MRPGADNRNPLRAIIAGAGVGGLAAAIALEQMGVQVVVFEAASRMEDIGAGLTLWPNAVKAVGRLAVDGTLSAVSVRIQRLELRTERGKVLSLQNLPQLERRFGAPLLAVHRAALQAVLLHRLGAERVCLGSRLTGFDQDESSVTVRFEDGREEHGDLLVGADGIHSAVRKQLCGPEPPRYSGYTAWRGVATLQDDQLPPDLGFEAWGRGSRFGAIPIGLRKVYWFATANAPEAQPDGPEERRVELLGRFGSWHEPVPALIRATPKDGLLRNDVYDRHPLSSWTQGRVTLLGDAAHATTPNLGQGAGMALEDAVVLAFSVRDARGDIAAGLKEYERQRLERTRKVTELSRRAGKLGQLENPLLCRLRDAATQLTPTGIQLRQLQWLLAYEP